MFLLTPNMGFAFAPIETFLASSNEDKTRLLLTGGCK